MRQKWNIYTISTNFINSHGQFGFYLTFRNTTILWPPPSVEPFLCSWCWNYKRIYLRQCRLKSEEWAQWNPGRYRLLIPTRVEYPPEPECTHTNGRMKRLPLVETHRSRVPQVMKRCSCLQPRHQEKLSTDETMEENEDTKQKENWPVPPLCSMRKHFLGTNGRNHWCRHPGFECPRDQRIQ